MKAVDLFSGCGGLTLGLRKAGFDVVGAIEVDALAAESYRLNHADTQLWEADIRRVGPTRFMMKLGLKPGELDLLAGCPPCQGFSSIRTLNGGREVNDSLNDLVFQFVSFVKRMQPRAIMMENVPGLASDWRMYELSKRLHRLGYKTNWEVVDIAAYGVPQRRRRMILVGSRDGDLRVAEPRSLPRFVRHAIGTLPPAGESGDPLHDFPERRSEAVRALIRAIPKDGGSRSDLPEKFHLDCHRRCDGFHDVYGRMRWDGVAPTITGGCVNPSKGRFLHPEADRTITLREAALLQSFPPRYRFSLRRGKFPAAQMIGNALPPKFIAYQARQIASIL